MYPACVAGEVPAQFESWNLYKSADLSVLSALWWGGRKEERGGDKEVAIALEHKQILWEGKVYRFDRFTPHSLSPGKTEPLDLPALNTSNWFCSNAPFLTSKAVQ